MQFNSHATSQDIVSYANEKSRQTNTTYPLATKCLHANEALRVIAELIHDASGGWRYDDGNQTDLPSSVTDLHADQRNYTLPIDTIGLAAVYVKSDGGDDDDWTRLRPLAFEEVPGAEPSYESTSGQPHSYRAINNSIILYPPSSYDETGGLRIEYDRDVSTFVTTDTTKKPGFDPTLHEAVACYMAWKFASGRLPDVAAALEKEWNGGAGENYKGGWVKRIKGHYARRFRDMYPTRIKSSLPISDYL